MMSEVVENQEQSGLQGHVVGESSGSAVNDDKSIEQLQQEAQELEAARLEQARQQARDAEAAAMARELAEDEGEDFNPDEAGMLDMLDQMPPEQKEQLVNAAADHLDTEEGAAEAAESAVEELESLLQEYAHPDFAIPESKKKAVKKRAKPVIQKYGSTALKMVLGEWKDEFLCAVSVGTLAYSSIKQIKQLKLDDAKKAKEQAEAEQQETAETA